MGKSSRRAKSHKNNNKGKETSCQDALFQKPSGRYLGRCSSVQGVTHREQCGAACSCPHVVTCSNRCPVHFLLLCASRNPRPQLSAGKALLQCTLLLLGLSQVKDGFSPDVCKGIPSSESVFPSCSIPAVLAGRQLS